jgi:hypothetical protein
VIVDRPLSIGEIFDRATTQVVRRWSLVVRPAVAMALIALLQAVVFPTAMSIRHAPLLWLVLALARTAVTLFALAGLALAIGGPDGMTYAAVTQPLRDGAWRIVRAALLYAFLVFVACIPVFGVVASSRTIGPLVFPIALVLLVPLAVLTFIVEVAFVDCVLEGTGATRSLMTAFERCWPAAGRWRMVGLALAVTLAQVVPAYALGLIIGAGSILLRVPALVAPLVAVVTPIPWIIVMALVTIAALDYRLRTEGTDLDAELDVPTPA